jgi:hypothetical protein
MHIQDTRRLVTTISTQEGLLIKVKAKVGSEENSLL